MAAGPPTGARIGTVVQVGQQMWARVWRTVADMEQLGEVSKISNENGILPSTEEPIFDAPVPPLQEQLVKVPISSFSQTVERGVLTQQVVEESVEVFEILRSPISLWCLSFQAKTKSCGGTNPRCSCAADGRTVGGRPSCGREDPGREGHCGEGFGRAADGRKGRLALDRLDVQFPSKEVARWVQAPTDGTWSLGGR